MLFYVLLYLKYLLIDVKFFKKFFNSNVSLYNNTLELKI